MAQVLSDLKDKIKYGKYKGSTVNEVIEEKVDAEYLMWAHYKYPGLELSNEILNIVRTRKNQQIVAKPKGIVASRSSSKSI